jgi:hypothetical protein
MYSTAYKEIVRKAGSVLLYVQYSIPGHTVVRKAGAILHIPGNRSYSRHGPANGPKHVTANLTSKEKAVCDKQIDVHPPPPFRKKAMITLIELV